MYDNLLERQLHFGLYRGVCQNNQDPTNHNRIQVSIPDLYGNSYITDWIPGCMPVAVNANHPDHVAHTATQVAALLTAHSISGTTGSGGNPSHTHSFSATAPHVGNSGTLTHPHQTSTDPLDTTTNSPEHTYHRAVPNIGQVVWIMFEKGDPNFPVWMGVYL